MLEEIMCRITLDLLNGREPNTDALTFYLGDYRSVDQVINGIKRAIALYNGELSLDSYEG